MSENKSMMSINRVMLISALLIQANAYRSLNVDGVRTILCMHNEYIIIQCSVDRPVAYCSFDHPDGRKYSVQNHDLNIGQCSVKVQVTEKDSGEWRCHMGTIPPGVELVQHTTVRVIDKMAAVKNNLTAVHGESVTLYCAASSKLPLTYCRFEPPIGQPFSVDSQLRQNKPLLNKYFYPANMSLDRGDCAVTILKVTDQDVGTWTCGASMDDGNEYTDKILVQVEGIGTSFSAGSGNPIFSVGIAVFVIILIFLGILVTWWKRKCLLSYRRQPEKIELEQIFPGSVTKTRRLQKPLTSDYLALSDKSNDDRAFVL